MTDLQKIREIQSKVMRDIAAGALIPVSYTHLTLPTRS